MRGLRWQSGTLIPASADVEIETELNEVLHAGVSMADDPTDDHERSTAEPGTSITAVNIKSYKATGAADVSPGDGHWNICRCHLVRGGYLKCRFLTPSR